MIDPDAAPRQAAILDALRAADRPLSPSQIAEATGLARLNVQAGLRELVDAGAVERPGYGRYVPAGAALPGHVSEPAAPRYVEEDPDVRAPIDTNRLGLVGSRVVQEMNDGYGQAWAVEVRFWCLKQPVRGTLGAPVSSPAEENGRAAPTPGA